MEELTDTEELRTVGAYRLDRILSEGRMGVLFDGRSRDGLRVALRVIRPQFAADSPFRQRLARETALLRQLTGPLLAPLVETGLDGEPPWLASAHLPGPSLAEAVLLHGSWRAETVRSLGVSLAQGLVTLHDRGLAHGDLTPGNVVLTEDGPHLVDFGIVGAFDAISRTALGVPMGTPPFLPPELLRGESEPGPAGDLFTLGCVLAHTAGASPFGDGPPADTLRRVLQEEPDLSRLAPPLREPVAACLAKDPAARPTLRELHSALVSAGRLTYHRLPLDVADLVRARQHET